MHQFEETRNLLEDSTIYYLIAVDMESKYSYINKRYHRIFDHVHGNLVGQHYSITIHPDDLSICSSVAEQAFTYPGKIFPAVIRKHDGKGGYIITQWEYKAMFDADNHPAGMFCIGHDITKFMQNSLELKDARKILNKTKLTLSQIAYTQSHVIRKPIANIMGLVLLLESMEMEPGMEGVFKMINESAKELDEVIRSMASKV